MARNYKLCDQLTEEMSEKRGCMKRSCSSGIERREKRSGIVRK